jgi:hypothetical protein
MPIGSLLRDKVPDIVVMSAVVALLTGCAVSPPRPVEVSLDRTSLEVRLSNGETCVGPVSATRSGSGGGAAVSGAGQLGGCSVALGYRVTADTGLNPVRLVLEEVFAAIGLPDAIAPAADVEITAPDGRRWLFPSPSDAGRA